MTTIDEVIERIPEWHGREVRAVPLTGGLTNTNYRVEVGGARYVVRIPGASTELLAVNREHEYHNTLAAASTGVGARLAHYLPDIPVMVLEFIDGPTMTSARLREPEQIARIAASVRALHAGPAFANTFNMFRTMDFYLEIVARHGFRIPDGYMGYVPVARRIEAAISARPLPLVPCNNDLLAENFIDDGTRLRLVDYEYSGNNDPCFELGNICNENDFAPEQVEQLCAAYFGQPSRALIARMWLYHCMSNIGWVLWGSIQNSISTIEYDFWDWTLTKWHKALAKVESPEFGQWLADAQS
ncbi:MAG TPA: choline/ethanolamine kinase family protein [Kouleothrix sp.]|uniref:phosphotransferase n=1 Tax=Kouleothrix sp. TaxID=2779161 RepID=UPI002CD552D5|nr:choline/ethanolamine kinase family protein [Kouleothrix sp.]HRC76365.1 choline/ethanolamine kinase family protein [Kouleothrix sp.]